MPSRPRSPITVALVDDYDVVLRGVANMFDQYRDRVVVAELDATMGVEDPESWSIPGTFTRTSSRVPSSTGRTATCRRHCRRESWSQHWRQSTPARWASAMFRSGCAALSGLIGPDGAKDSAIESRTSWPSSPRARAT